jgi:cytochrome c2
MTLLIGSTVMAVRPIQMAAAHKAKPPVMVPVPQQTSMLKLLQSRYSQAQLAAGTFVGSEFCLACHTGAIAPDEREWRDTNHAHVLRKPMGMYSLQPGEGVLANYLGDPAKDDFMMGLDFNQLSGTPFDDLKPNAPILSYDAATDQYYIQLGPSGIKLLVAATWAGMSVGNGQRYMVRIPVTDTPTGYSNAIYFAPFAWSGHGYSSNASAWYDGSTPKYAPGIASTALDSLQGQNYLKNCAGCHITGIRSNGVTPQGEYVTHPYPAVLVPPNSPDYPDLDGDGIPDMANIGCESCHGPGSAHILGGGDPTKIVNPVDISNNQQRSETCLQCHVEIASAPNKTWGYTYDETDNKPFVMTNPPDDLSKYQVFTGEKWPDGVHYLAERIDDFKSSAHYQGAHGIACNDCHDAMAETQNPAQVRDVVSHSGITVTNANVNDDSFCLACHHDPYFAAGEVTGQDVIDWKSAGFDAPIPDKIRDAIEEHTHHPYGATRMLGLSRCIECHMAPSSGHGTIGGYSHTFYPARPEDTITYADVTGLEYGATGNPNSCSASCHRGKVILWSDVPANLTPTSMKFGTANEVKLANHLVQYFGPGGLWWDTTPASASAQK